VLLRRFESGIVHRVGKSVVTTRPWQARVRIRGCDSRA
jgi:hypothetical protein